MHNSGWRHQSSWRIATRSKDEKINEFLARIKTPAAHATNTPVTWELELTRQIYSLRSGLGVIDMYIRLIRKYTRMSLTVSKDLILSRDGSLIKKFVNKCLRTKELKLLEAVERMRRRPNTSRQSTRSISSTLSNI